MSLWRIFIPNHLLSDPPTFLSGCVNYDLSLVCVLKTSPEPHCHHDTNGSQQCVIGRWHGQTTADQLVTPVLKDVNSDVCLDLYLSQCNTLQCCLSVVEEGKHALQKSVCVTYDPRDLVSSYFLSECPPQSTSAGDNIGYVIKCLLSDRQMTDSGVVRQDDTSAGRKDTILNLIQRFLAFFVFLGGLTDQRFVCWPSLQTLLTVPDVVSQFRTRHNQIANAVSVDTTQPLSQLRVWNVCVRQVVDSMVGVAVLIFMLHTDAAQNLSLYIMTWADDVASYLVQLLNWLMGAPAGLKLNAQLAQYLGHFFLYQLYLWTGYLSILRPVLPAVLQGAMFVGILGVSFQVCLIQDIISMLTIHIYCFYVYAARIYFLQVYTLSSLWRLFRGKKRNVLRQRVDSVEYDFDQLFIGTLLFTVLLFLLPTVALHYFVFLALRLLILCGHGLITRFVTLFNTVPVFSLTLWLLNSCMVTGKVFFSVVTDSAHSDPLVLSMQTRQLPFTEVLHLTADHSTQTSASYTWSVFLARLLKGHLIYPWVSPKSDREKVD